MTQRRLAQLLGVSQVNVSRIEGGSDMRVSTLVEMARALGLEPMLVPKSAVPAVRALLDDLAAGDISPERGRFE